jgi:hypothetical protein
MGYGAKLTYAKDDSGQLVSTLEHGLEVDFEASLAFASRARSWRSPCP